MRTKDWHKKLPKIIWKNLKCNNRIWQTIYKDDFIFHGKMCKSMLIVEMQEGNIKSFSKCWSSLQLFITGRSPSCWLLVKHLTAADLQNNKYSVADLQNCHNFQICKSVIILRICKSVIILQIYAIKNQLPLENTQTVAICAIGAIAVGFDPVTSPRKGKLWHPTLLCCNLG